MFSVPRDRAVPRPLVASYDAQAVSCDIGSYSRQSARQDASDSFITPLLNNLNLAGFLLLLL
jgi:hypothetical protein